MSDDTETIEDATAPAEGPAADEATRDNGDAPPVDDPAAGDAATSEAEGSDGDNSVEVQPAPLNDLGDDQGEVAPPRDIGLLANIEVELSVELGRANVPMRRLLTLSPGAVVEIDRPAGTAVDILVNGTPVARGEVVVVDGDFGVRVTEVLARG